MAPPAFTGGDITGRRQPAATESFALEWAGHAVPVMVIRSARRKRTVSIAVSGGGVTVRSPVRTPQRHLIDALNVRRAWILKRMAAAAPVQPAEIATGTRLPWLGRDLVADVRLSATRKARAERFAERLFIEIPVQTREPERGAAAREAVLSWYREAAGEILPRVAVEVSERVGLIPRRVLVRTQRARWGSCAADGTIRLNWRLVMLEPELVEYVVLHELAHLREKNHQTGFWGLLTSISPDCGLLRRRLTERARQLPQI